MWRTVAMPVRLCEREREDCCDWCGEAVTLREDSGAYCSVECRDDAYDADHEEAGKLDPDAERRDWDEEIAEEERKERNREEIAEGPPADLGD